MDLNKHLEFFDPIKLKGIDVTIIGIGAVGSHIADQLARLGVAKLNIYEFDTVDFHNVANQTYTSLDYDKTKIDALSEHLKAINPEIEIQSYPRYEHQMLSGIVFLEVDSIKVRRDFAEANEYNELLKLVIDGRIGLEDGQVHIIDWTDQEYVSEFVKELQSQSDDNVAVKVSACGTVLSVIPTVLVVAAYAVSILINYVNKAPFPKNCIYINAFKYTSVAL